MNAPDLSTYYAVHTSLRKAAHRLAAAAAELDGSDARRMKAYRAYWKGYVGEVVAHHTIEDDFFFPVLAERVPVVREQMARLAGEHHDLDELMAESDSAIKNIVVGADGSGAGAASVLGDLALHMDAHLDFEDADILPLFVRHFTAEEYDELNDRALKSLGISKQAVFTVPFVATSISPAEREHVLAEAPAAFRMLFRMTRRRHTRMAATAFGAAVLEGVQ